MVCRLPDIGHKTGQPLVVETKPIDQCLGLGQTKHARLGVSLLWQRRDRANFDKTKAHGAQRVDAAGIFIHSCSQADPVGKAQSGKLNRVLHPGIAIGPLQWRALGAGQRVEREVVRGFRVELEQKGAGQGIGEERHWIIPG